MQTYHSSAEILAEDARRRSRLAKPVDPVTGLNAGGDRFLLHLSDCLLSDQYLPQSILRRPNSISPRAVAALWYMPLSAPHISMP